MKRILSGLSGWKKYLVLYLFLLLISHLLMRFAEKPLQPEVDELSSVSLKAVRGDSLLADNQIQLYYENIYTGNEEDPRTLLLLPGGPEGSGVFDELKGNLSSTYRLIIPHFRNYPKAVDELPDYSFRALSGYASQLLQKLDLQNANVVAYGLGGASAAYMSHDYPENVNSLTFVSAIGVQELELLGSYRLNHAVYGFQLGAVWLLQNAVPHFGLLDLVGIDVSYAKIHYESDLRPVRDYLKEYQKPMLIIHGNEDALVPPAVAREHNRIVPQSRLEILVGDHDLIEVKSDSVANLVNAFVDDVETGKALWASDASEQRLNESKEPFTDIQFKKFSGVALIIIMLIIMLSTFVSEDLTCIGAGLLAARGLIGYWPATLACFLGIFLGDIGLYMAGRVLGRPAVRKAPFKWIISEKDLNKSAHWFEARGPAIIIASRFLPGSRLPTYFSAGVIGAGFLMFVSYFLLAALLWTPMLVGVSKLIGNELIRYFTLYKDYALWIFLGGVLLLLTLAKFVFPAFSYRGRRMLISRYRRFKRWEYWSPFIIYFPVTIYVLFQGIKHWCMTLFTAANPAIPDGGFIGESKSDILELFDKSYVARYKFISYESDYEKMLYKAEAFMEEHNLTFPVVLKPNIGERGREVGICRNHVDMQEYLANIDKDIIIQEFIPGEEYGIFYYQYPENENGDIFSITTIELLSVRGDGERTLEELILEDKRAVCMAQKLLKQNEEHLYDVPEVGEDITLVNLGTHNRGAIFCEGEHLITPELVDEMNEICSSIDGYYFGRLDIKAPDDQQLKKGEGLQIIEANGVTSESTNIYDPGYSFWDAERILMKQWKIAFEIGKQNKAKGAEVTPVISFLRNVFDNIKKS